MSAQLQLIEESRKDLRIFCDDARSGYWILLAMCRNTCNEKKIARCRIRKAEIEKGELI